MRFSSIIRSTVFVVLGLILALALAAAVELFGAVVYPFPADFDGSSEAMLDYLASYPGWLFAAGALMWGASVLASTWLATRFGTARHAAHGIVVGLVLLVAVIFNMFFLPYPWWFEVANLVLFPYMDSTYFTTLTLHKNVIASVYTASC